MSNVMTQTEAQAMVEDILAYERGGEPLTEGVEKFWAPVLEKAMGVKMSPRDSKVITSAFIEYFRRVAGDYVADWRAKTDFVVTRTKDYDIKWIEKTRYETRESFTFPERFVSKGRFEFDVGYLYRQNTVVGRMTSRLLGPEALEAMIKNLATALAAEGQKFSRFATEAIKQYFTPSEYSKEYFHDEIYEWFRKNGVPEELEAEDEPGFVLTLNYIKVSPRFKVVASRSGPGSTIATDVETEWSVKVTDIGEWVINPDYRESY